MAGFEVIVEQMSRVGIEGDIWIDGSFLTTKMEPDDIDLLLVIAEHHIGSLSRDQHDFVEWIQSSDRDPKLSLLCDPDLVFRLPSELEWYDHHCGSILRHYEHIYGRSVVAGEPKGIVVLSVTKSLPPPRTLSTPASTGLEPDLTQTKSESKGKE